MKNVLNLRFGIEVKTIKFIKGHKTIHKDKLEKQRSPSLFEELMLISKEVGKQNNRTCRICNIDLSDIDYDI